MKHFVLTLALVLPLSATAQEAAPEPGSEPEAEAGEIEEGFSLMEEGARLLLRGLMTEVEPALDDFAGMAQELQPALEMLASEMGPALMELAEKLDSVRHYEAPEILPNGDIIIRRSPDAPAYVPPEPDAVIDL